jgi:hypothetical protein
VLRWTGPGILGKMTFRMSPKNGKDGLRLLAETQVQQLPQLSLRPLSRHSCVAECEDTAFLLANFLE